MRCTNCGAVNEFEDSDDGIRCSFCLSMLEDMYDIPPSASFGMGMFTGFDFGYWQKTSVSANAVSTRTVKRGVVSGWLERIKDWQYDRKYLS